MPKIYKYLGFVISFFVHDHPPIHVHVKRGGREIKAEFHYENGKLKIIYKKTKNSPLKEEEISEINPFLMKNHNEIRSKWDEVFVMKKTIEMEEVKRKVK